MQGIPHIASTPHDGRSSPVPPARRAEHAEQAGRDMTRRMPPTGRRPRGGPAPQLPVFIDQSGWRRRTLQGMALAVVCACLGYLLLFGTLIGGLWQPVGTQPPSTNGPVPSGQDTGRSAPPAGGLKQ
ncbi:hypothetical protein [Streptomyces sp. MZ04]|uniref:hypothetical protein n=1 Tax=Streptomyces sp. MZ04 TaxID=2559236 RepID=UPI00107E72AA|nr:hypothetical protein [Streptomyces sp. MZ04]TGB12113.1 hypothetical protein E2651_12210 [Streptomyces sp. MZ04]